MISVATAGGTVTNYSPRFTLSGMTGTFPANVLAGLKTVSGTAGPATVNSVAQSNQNPAAGAGAAAGGPAASLYSIPYPDQTGLTRYAPMPPQPVTSITMNKPTPQWPTSAVQYAQTNLPTPSVVTTITATVTFSVSSMENTVWKPHLSSKFILKDYVLTPLIGCGSDSTHRRDAEVFESVERLDGGIECSLARRSICPSALLVIDNEHEACVGIIGKGNYL